MAKRKRKRARKASTTKKRTTRRKKRAAVANPPRRRRRSSARRRVGNPRRRHRRVARRAHANPAKRRSSGRRRRRNPGLGKLPFMAALKAIAAAGGAFVGAQILGNYLPGDPVQTYTRNRAIGAAILGGVGLYLAAKGKPGIGLAMVGGAALGAFGGHLTAKAFSLLPQRSSVSAVFSDSMQAVFSDSMQGVGDYAQIGEYSQMGDIRPPAPWLAATPFN